LKRKKFRHQVEYRPVWWHHLIDLWRTALHLLPPHGHARGKQNISQRKDEQGYSEARTMSAGKLSSSHSGRPPKAQPSDPHQAGRKLKEAAGIGEPSKRMKQPEDPKVIVVKLQSGSERQE